MTDLTSPEVQFLVRKIKTQKTLTMILSVICSATTLITLLLKYAADWICVAVASPLICGVLAVAICDLVYTIKYAFPFKKCLIQFIRDTFMQNKKILDGGKEITFRLTFDGARLILTRETVGEIIFDLSPVCGAKPEFYNFVKEILRYLKDYYREANSPDRRLRDVIFIDCTGKKPKTRVIIADGIYRVKQ